MKLKKHWMSAGTTRAAAWIVGAGLCLASVPAWACGGFFCDQNTGVVNQTAERIIFVDNPDDTVTSVVQILYEGPADEFSWILPVPGVPEVGVSSNIAFQRLQQLTNPTYRLNVTIEGECGEDRATADLANNTSNNAEFDDSPGGGGGVEVIAGGSVGPFDYEVISVDPGLEDAAEVAVAWLDDNGYDVTAIGPDLLRPYLEDGLNLIGFRLSKDNAAGEVRPVTLTYSDDHPMIPIKLTAVAAEEDMGVMAFVLGEGRSVPSNYRHLILNEAIINWFNPTSNYNDVINLAADESGGQGFITEYAAPTADIEEPIFSQDDERQFERLQELAQREDVVSLVEEALINYRGWDGLRDTIFAHVTLREGARATLDELLDCPFCFDLFDVVDFDVFDAASFIESLEANVIEPLRATQELYDSRPYMTRLFTTMSAPEMTLDPGFFFNAELSDVSNVHVAEQIIECNPEVDTFDAPWRVELPQGDVVRGSGRAWPFDTEGGMLANREIQQLSEEGEGEVIADNSTMITQAIEVSNGATPQVFPSNKLDDKGCATAPGEPASPMLPALLLMGLGFFVRRRR